MEGLGRLVAAGCDPRTLRLENQSAPVAWIEPALAEFDLELCLDIGHLKLTGQDLGTTLSRWHPRIGALHIHGVADGRDHRSLTCLSSRDRHALSTYLQSFRGSVSVEVFDFPGLRDSLLLLETWMA